MFTKNDLLDIAVKMEENGKAVYDRARGEIKNKELKSLLEWMGQEEEGHQKWFLQQKETQAGKPDEKDFSTILPDVLQEMMGENTLSLDDVTFSEITHTTQMLKIFIEFENDTLLFYEFLETFLQDKDALGGLEKIIQEERAHVEKLNEMVRAIEAHSIPEENLSF